MDFSLPPDIEALRLRVRGFIAETVLPLEGNAANYDAYENIRLGRSRDAARQGQDCRPLGSASSPRTRWNGAGDDRQGGGL